MMQSTTPSIAEQNSSSRLQGRHLVWYCLVLLLIPFSVMVGCFTVLISDWFPPRAGNTYVANLGYGVKLHNTSCDVLIAGDSSALVGVIPAAITRQTGLSSCNIAEFGGMEQVNGTMILDQFLKNNPRPKFLVFVYVPENLSPHTEWTEVSHFEAILFRFHTRPDAAFLLSLAMHPKEGLSFMTLGIRLVAQAAFKKPLSEDTLKVRERNLGWLAVPGTVLTECMPQPAVKAPDSGYVQSLRSRYGVDGTQVIIDVIPEPVCDANYDYYTAKLPGIIDNHLQQYPVGLYNNSGTMHLIESGAERFSGEIAQQISVRQSGNGLAK